MKFTIIPKQKKDHGVIKENLRVKSSLLRTLDENDNNVVPGRPNVLTPSTTTASMWENKYVGGCRVSYSRNVRRMTLQRWICSKIVFHMDKVKYEEILVLYDNLLWCQDKVQKDPGFSAKFGVPLEVLTKILKETRFSESTISGTLKKLSLRIREDLHHFVYPERNLNTVYQHVRGTFHILLPKEAGVPNKQLPPRRYVGVGYKDKGSARNKAVDGSPSWQDVAMRKVT